MPSFLPLPTPVVSTLYDADVSNEKLMIRVTATVT